MLYDYKDIFIAEKDNGFVLLIDDSYTANNSDYYRFNELNEATEFIDLITNF